MASVAADAADSLPVPVRADSPVRREKIHQAAPRPTASMSPETVSSRRLPVHGRLAAAFYAAGTSVVSISSGTASALPTVLEWQSSPELEFKRTKVITW